MTKAGYHELLAYNQEAAEFPDMQAVNLFWKDYRSRVL